VRFRSQTAALATSLLFAACAGLGSRARMITEIGPGKQATIEADGAHYTVIVRAWGEGSDCAVSAGPPPTEIVLGARGSTEIAGEGRRTFHVRNLGDGKATVDLSVRGATYANLIGPVPKP
jgi:hypothetical protein